MAAGGRMKPAQPCGPVCTAAASSPRAASHTPTIAAKAQTASVAKA